MANTEAVEAPEITKEKDVDLLKVELTDEEILELSKRSAKAHSERGRLESDLDGIKKRYKADIEEKENEISECSGLINCGYEYRDIDCEWTFYWKKGKKELVRLDTGEVVRTLMIQPHERQKQIAQDEEESKAEK